MEIQRLLAVKNKQEKTYEEKGDKYQKNECTLAFTFMP
jgi:hypothetical protein